MRNSIAHGHCLDRFKINNYRQITHITFKDFYNESRTFEVELGLSDMLYIIKTLKKIVVGYGFLLLVLCQIILILQNIYMH